MRERVMMRVGAGEHSLAPTFGAGDQIETALESSLGQIYQAHWAGALKLRELAEIVAAGMNAHTPNSADVEDVAKHLFDAGVSEMALRRPIAEFLIKLLWAPESARGKLDAEWGDPNASDIAA